MSIERATNQLWPAVDLLRSTSLRTHGRSGRSRTLAVATATRDLLRHLKTLEQRIRSENVYQLSAEDRQVLNRGRRMERFFTQPFFVAEEYTKRPGAYVSLADTIRGCAAILAGECDDLPEAAFLFSGTIEQVREKAREGTR